MNVNRIIERTFCRILTCCAVLSGLWSSGVFAAEITRVTAGREDIYIAGRGEGQPIGIVELAPYQNTNQLADAPVVGQALGKGAFKIKVPRWDGERDRLYSGF